MEVFYAKIYVDDYETKYYGGNVMLTDIEIAKSADMKPITEIAGKLGLDGDDIELYGKYKAKIPFSAMKKFSGNKNGKLILVTAINPTPAGEGKTTTTVGLGQAFNRIGKKAIIALREPSLGPCMGVKGGAAGGGYSQIVPMDDINLHFTGDIHAVTTTNNLLAAMIDNHIYQGNALGIDPTQVVWKRVLDLNDRQLRNIVSGIGGKANGVPREDGFMISVASEIMAILGLSEDLEDMKQRFSRIVVAYTRDGRPVTAHDLKAEGAMAALMKDAIKPNLVQTLENTPVLVHAGPFANIAHGCNSVAATKLAQKLADYVVTEAGFGADLGAEKFFDIKCRLAGLVPDAAVLVATIRALKYNGGVPLANIKTENAEAVKKGFVNLEKHVENLRKFGVPVVVAINAFTTDTEREIETLEKLCKSIGVDVVFTEVWAKGGQGGVNLANTLIDLMDAQPSKFKPLYDSNLPIKEKIRTIASEIYGAASVSFTPAAEKSIKTIESMGAGNTPVCMAKTQYSLSDNPKLLGRPSGFELTVRDVRLSAGAGFVVAVTGEIMTMPGLPKIPAAENIDVDKDGNITGLF